MKSLSSMRACKVFSSPSWIGLCFFKPDVVKNFLEHIVNFLNYNIIILSSCDLLFGFHALWNYILWFVSMQILYYSENIEMVWPLYGMCYASLLGQRKSKEIIKIFWFGHTKALIKKKWCLWPIFPALQKLTHMRNGLCISLWIVC